MQRLRTVGGLAIFACALNAAEVSTQCKDLLKSTAADIFAQTAGSDRNGIIRQVLGQPEIMAPCLTSDLLLIEKLAQVIEIRRIDKQVGTASGGTAGSTSLVSSGAAPRLLGLAVEHGAIAQALSGSTTTFRTTPAKLITALSKAYGPEAPLPDDATIRALGRVSMSASFDTTRTASGDSPNGSPFQANYRQLSEATLRAQLWNDRDPLSRRNFARIRAVSQSDNAKLHANEAARFLRAIKSAAAHDDAVKEATDKLKAATTAEGIESALLAYVGQLAEMQRTQPGAGDRLRALVDSWVKADADHKELYRQIAKAPMLTFEYAFERPPVIKATAATASPLAPDHHTGRLLYAASILDAEYTVTAAATWFHDARPGMRGNFRSFQLGGKIDIPLGEIPPLAAGKLTFSALYLNLHQKPLGFDLKIQDEKVNKPGAIGFFQVKYTIPLSDNGVSIPISLTMSNRTELIKEREIRGNIGLTFDLDKLMARK